MKSEKKNEKDSLTSHCFDILSSRTSHRLRGINIEFI
ncbi:unnamed protein product [Arabidopsis halleri]